VDPGLSTWIKASPTVMLKLYSHVTCDEETGNTILTPCQILIDRRKDNQILWKLWKQGEYDSHRREEVGDRLKLVSWLNADPLSILPSGNVICLVHHGGRSHPYHEALRQVSVSIHLSKERYTIDVHPKWSSSLG